MVGLLRELVELESPTGRTRAMADRMSEQLERLGGEVREAGEHVVADFAGEGPSLLLLGHLDTVWDVGTLGRLPWRVEDGRAYGPGVYDMKGGLVIALAALAAATPGRRAVRFVLNADEEVGSPTGREVIAEAADGAAAAFVVEPPLPNGGLKTARKGLGRFRFTVRGKAAHAGTNLEDGSSAVEELAHQILRLHRLNDPARGISVNVGIVRGGTRENVVAEVAEADVDVRLARSADLVELERALEDTRPQVPGAEVTVTGRWTRPPLERTPGSARLFDKAREHGRAIGLELVEGASGGGSDANLVAPLGLPVLDGLGAEGAGAHSVDEHVLVAALPLRARLLAALLRDPGL